MSSAKKMLLSAAGNASEPVDVSQVFSTFLYVGNGSAQVLDNGIDLSGEGGMVWYRSRAASNGPMEDTVRGLDKSINSDTIAAEADGNIYGVQAFNSNGFTAGVTVSGTKNVSWTFRKAPKFFDIVTYTGNGSNRTIAHSLDSTVGMIMIKNTGVNDPWAVYHRGANEATNAENYYFVLNTTAAKVASANWWNNTAPTSSVFTVGTDHSVNANGENYVAYLFAHNNDDGEFGPDGDQDIIKCGTFQGQGTYNIGFEPQWIMIKRDASATNGDWFISDNMRGWSVEGSMKERFLAANLSTQEGQDSGDGVFSNADSWEPTATGFRAYGSPIGTAGTHYIYMAIRAPMITPPEAATDVFSIDTANSTSNAPPVWNSGFPVDMAFYNVITGGDRTILSRMTGKKYLKINATNADANDDDGWDFMNGWYDDSFTNSNFYSWMWKRAKGFFDVVCYTGTGANRTVAHSLGVVPEMMWIKKRSGSYEWIVYSPKGDGYLRLNTNEVYADSSVLWNDTDPTSTVFSLGEYGHVNGSGETYVAYLFATLAGISKLGTVSHSGSSTDVNCGFSNGARCVILKRTDSNTNGDWYFWDSVRGIIAGNDPYLLLSTTAAQVTNTDYIDPLASGFQISGDFTDGDYIFYAIA